MPPAGPLEGITVVDCTQILAGPYCTMLLADMGADVVKIEKPQGGDDTRRMGPPFVDGVAASFLMVNRNKRSIVLDLKNPEGAGILRKMVERADIMVENLRPGAMVKLGLGYEDVRKVNPALVYCTISAFGVTGPYGDRAGFDLVAQGMSGHMSFTGMPDGPPVKVGVPITDLNAGMYAVYGILCAYMSRLKTGKGQLVDTSLLEGGIGYTVWESASFFATGDVPGPVGSAHRMTAPYQSFKTSDAYVNIGAATQGTWERLCEAIERPDLLDDPRFATNASRVENLEALAATLEETLVLEDRSHWLRVLEEHSVPSGPIYDMSEVYADPQVQAREMVADLDPTTSGESRTIGIPVKLSETPGSIRSPSPSLGQHTDEVLSEMGYAPAEIARLRDNGIVE